MPIPSDELIITHTGFVEHFQIPLQPCDLTLSQFFHTLVITVPGGIFSDSYLTHVNTQRETEIMSGCPDHQRMDP